MQKSSFVLNIILALAVAVLYYLHFTGPRHAGPAPAKNTAKSDLPPIVTKAPEIKLKSSPVVFVNADSLMEQYVLVTKNRKFLEAERSKFEKEFEAKYRSLEAEYKDLQEKAPLLTQEEGTMKQQELMMKEQKLGEFRDQNQERLMNLEQTRGEQIQKNITTYLRKKYANTNYAYILGYSPGSGILFAHDSLDITPEVVQGLNSEAK
jgi:outer membrane protein